VLGAVLGAVFARALLVKCTPQATLLLAAGFFFVARVPCTLLRVPAASWPCRPPAHVAVR